MLQTIRKITKNIYKYLKNKISIPDNKIPKIMCKFSMYKYQYLLQYLFRRNNKKTYAVKNKGRIICKNKQKIREHKMIMITKRPSAIKGP